MKLVMVFLTILNSFSLVAGLNKNKMYDAVIKAQFDQINDHFFYVLCEEDPLLIEKEDKVDQSFRQKVYGPYALVLKGIEPGTPFSLYTFNLLELGNPPCIGSGYIDQEGEAWIQQETDDIKLTSALNAYGGMLPGEPMYSMVVLGNNETYLATRIIPNPLETYGDGGRHVTMQFFTHQDPKYRVVGENFKPEEEIRISIRSISDIITKYLKATKEGTFNCLIEGDRSRGQLARESLLISTAHQTEPMTISYGWEFLNAGKARRTK